MKFAKELEQDLVPEWRLKYLNYKAGKKHIKAVTRAVNRMNATPKPPARPNLGPQDSNVYVKPSPAAPRNKPASTLGVHDGANDESAAPLRTSPAPLGADSRPESDESSEDPARTVKKTPPMPIVRNSKSPKAPAEGYPYGSFVPTPPQRSSIRAAAFALPDPAISPEAPVEPAGAETTRRDFSAPTGVQRSASISVPQSAYEVGQTTSPAHKSAFNSLRSRLPQNQNGQPFIRRVFTAGAPSPQPSSRRADIDMIAVDQVKQRQREFFAWMDKELDKVETFYRSKEDEAGARLKVLREQLHEMRNRRIEEVAEAQRAKQVRREDERTVLEPNGTKANGHSKSDDDGIQPTSRDQLHAWLDPVERFVGETKARALGPRPGQNSRALQNMRASPEMASKNLPDQNRQADDGRDYVRRAYHDNDVPYRTAKRKLKLALQEFYRGMELLKSYALLNRTAFRKINKKYDKAVDAHPPLRYMNEKVNKAWFVNSDVLDGHIHAVEDLYARYFERGNHKIATGKLRSSTGRPADQSGNAFRNGLLIGIGGVFLIQGIIYGFELLHSHDAQVKMQTSYLLQIYAGYFLGLYLFFWFCLDCSIWSHHKINYVFVFEFDPRHNLDWRQLADFPSFFMLLLGVIMWLNFTQYGSPEMFIYYPVILIGVTALIIFFPGPLFFHRSRQWFVYSHWRLLLAGLYPVEFRDFFLGDMFCSLTYLMSNLELFFCLYVNHWTNPTQCNSNHSRLLGFLSALPGIWRALQCMRRYYDTRNVFPHLVNCGKYMMTIMYYTTLSMYRIERDNKMLALFCTFAVVNAIYCSTWDLLMDWSLLQPNANRPLLRDVRGYKSTWWYYAAMIIDPVLRFNWIFYAIYTHDLQHNSMASFFVGFSEVSRRGMWTLFRVENEHCSNVARFKASRDVPLPYDIDSESQRESLDRQDDTRPDVGTLPGSPTLSRHRTHTSSALEDEPAPGGSSLRRRPLPGRSFTFTQMVADAHTQDFEKKRKPAQGDAQDLEHVRTHGSSGSGVRGNSSDEEDDDDPDEHDLLDVEELLRERRGDSHGDGRGDRERSRGSE